MKNYNFIILVSVLMLFLNACKSDKSNTEQDESSIEESHYLGQKPPSLIPEVFAPGIVSLEGRNEAAISFSSGLTEVYFQGGSENEKLAIYFSRLEGNKWTPIEKAAFTKGRKDEEIQPFVSPDGKRIYFTAYSSDVFDTGIWYVNRLEHSWSDAIKLDLPIEDDKSFGSNQAKNGTLYYWNISKRKNYSAAYKNGSFPEPKEFEVEPSFYHALASPNEDYLVGHSPNKEDEGREDDDIYVSFKKQDRTWGKPINLGSTVNSNVKESVPTISPDGKYLFFGRDEDDGTANIYWVSTEVIEKLRPKQ